MHRRSSNEDNISNYRASDRALAGRSLCDGRQAAGAAEARWRRRGETVPSNDLVAALSALRRATFKGSNRRPTAWPPARDQGDGDHPGPLQLLSAGHYAWEKKSKLMSSRIRNAKHVLLCECKRAVCIGRLWLVPQTITVICGWYIPVGQSLRNHSG